MTRAQRLMYALAATGGVWLALWGVDSLRWVNPWR